MRPRSGSMALRPVVVFTSTWPSGATRCHSTVPPGVTLHAAVTSGEAAGAPEETEAATAGCLAAIAAGAVRDRATRQPATKPPTNRRWVRRRMDSPFRPDGGPGRGPDFRVR